MVSGTGTRIASISGLRGVVGDGIDPVVAAERRPPRAELETGEGMNAWIDTYHAVRGLTRQGTFVFLTDSAVGAHEEDNLRHLVTNLGRDVPRERIVLTIKSSLAKPAVKVAAPAGARPRLVRVVDDTTDEVDLDEGLLPEKPALALAV